MGRIAGGLRVAAGILLLGLPRPGAAQPVEVPLEAHGGRLVVPVEGPGGTQLAFLLSTGSVTTVLTGSSAALAKAGGLTLGGLPIPTDDTEVVDDGTLVVAGRTFDGVVSSNMLGAFDLLLDVPGGRMVVKPVGRTVAWGGVRLSEPVRVRVYHGIVLGLDVEVDGRPYPAMLDLGVAGVQVNEGVPLTGDRATLGIGAVTFDVPARLGDHPVFERFSPNGDGFVLVGAAFALDCPVALSWAHRELRTCVR